MSRSYRRMTTRRKLFFAILSSVIIVRLAIVVLDYSSPRDREIPSVQQDYHVHHIDDSLLLHVEGLHDGKKAIIRLLGVSPADTSIVRNKAVSHLQDVTRNRGATLRFDRRRIDEQGHFLAHVYVDQKLLSLRLIETGLARRDTRGTDSSAITRQLIKAERNRRNAFARNQSPDRNQKSEVQ